MGAAADGALVVEWAWAGAPLAGERQSGDAHVVAAFDGGALVALVDGLGHGPEAAQAARQATSVLAAFAGEPVEVLVERCHERLRGTRGAVLSVASIDARSSSMTWLGVGNVEALLLRADPAAARGREAITPRGGVVGYQLPPLRVAALPVAPGDTLVMASDGIRSGFVAELQPRGSPEAVARSILTRFSRGTDDAHVVVARYLGARP